MNLTQIESNLQQVIQAFNKNTFIYDLLLAYGQPKASITRLQKGGLNLSKIDGEIAWKKKLFFKAVENEDLHLLIDTIKGNGKTIKHDPRFIVVTDFETLLAIDCKTSDSLDIPILELAKHFDFFLPLVGMEKAQQQFENPADVKAAVGMAKLYDEIKKDNPTDTPEQVHNLNVFLSRLLFCFFAEDTGIFEKSQFTYGIGSYTQQDGSDLNTYLDKLFEVMNTAPQQRQNLPAYLEAFPYVNGGLFRNVQLAPVFTRQSRKAAIESGELQWKDINPDIFGSMIQAVITPEHRGGLGMHYTSVPNIMKVIEPLFLNELYEEFEAAKGNIKKLNALLQRIWKIKLFDPACGSGNFLIIAYKELRRLEMKIFKEIDLTNQVHSNQFTGISLGNFYGIEIDDFAHEVATLSLWLAEHQMNQEFFAAFGRTKPALPLKETGNIVHGNACRLDWEQVCPKNEGDEIYIMGNPPYLGASVQDESQKQDMIFVFNGNENFRKQDYISVWFFLAAKYLNHNSKYAFVSTNSICQGAQVEMTWPLIFNLDLEIFFTHKDFKWANSAKNNAGVICSIIGIRKIKSEPKYIFIDNLRNSVSNINAYLINAQNTIVNQSSKPISDLPKMTSGNKPLDGGNLILSEEEKNELVKLNPEAIPLLRKFIGSSDYIRGEVRWCLWIQDHQLELARSIPIIRERLVRVKEMRLNGGNNAQVKANVPHKFEFSNEPTTSQIIVPRVSSIRRDYIPMGFVDLESVIADSSQVIFDAEPYVFGVINSKMHMVWVRITAGRLKTDFRYSSYFSYHTFPFPQINDRRKEEITQCVYRILEEREKHSEKTLAQLYDPDKMPEGLREAHRQNDLAIERCYRSRPFESDEERLEYLFKLYEQMIEEEKTKGTLFAGEKIHKNRKLK